MYINNCTGCNFMIRNGNRRLVNFLLVRILMKGICEIASEHEHLDMNKILEDENYFHYYFFSNLFHRNVVELNN